VTIYRVAGYNLATVSTNVQTALENWFGNRSNTGIGDNLLVQDIVAALANITGLGSYTLTSPTTNTVIGEGEVPTLGTLTIADGGTV